ncbi:Tat binding protein 1-interacting [Pyrenophora tritici-repentis]|uniref:Periplasmic protein TonB n=1 Tax=Pyrenophora tritici-repentis TaxID=45151 RepID=A0A2W1GV88_9PLEO|nr:Tat binding protein 1-interacting [Pyrenophora tritici-repentis]KAF7445020.1 Tat binding protein 1-interacting [Pyrenophora tritici-repentis]KAF7565284.1 Periplasmic protein TonB [Pyrenophora tritici-repentis]KAI0572731.1 Tat binding protein 1-interacting [Pyrenophora tritici-repentis]KAI0587480.1 Tat binding protein 1-interacting [Pyrenophora tritici-repentis]
MAPRKKTEEKATANEAADMVLQYLHKQNRPYSAIDVSANLHNKVTKAAAAKILKDLHEQKLIEGRAAGKQIVYHALQNAAEACTTSELAALDTTILDLRTRTTALLATAKALRSTLSSLNSTLSTADLVTHVHALEQEKTQLETRLDALRKGKAKKISREEREGVEMEWKKWGKVAKARERIVKEMWGVIEEGVGDLAVREEMREMFDLDG